MTEKWGEIQGKWDLVRVSGEVRVIRVRVTGVLLHIIQAKVYQKIERAVAISLAMETL